jgi:hypothetical protein
LSNTETEHALCGKIIDEVPEEEQELIYYPFVFLISTYYVWIRSGNCHNIKQFIGRLHVIIIQSEKKYDILPNITVNQLWMSQ